MSQPSNSSPVLTLAIIVRNDRERLDHTLAAVGSAVDEIVVCDTSEEEGIRECVARYGGRVIEYPWCDSFAVARNECMRHVRGRWILWLDAGETMDGADVKRLKEHLHTVSQPTAFMLLVKLPPADGAIDGEQIARVRLIPNQAGVRFAGRVRESLHASLQQLSIPVEGLAFRIQRSPDEHDTDRKQQRARRNIELADTELRETGAQPQLLNCLGEAFQVLGENVQAASYYRHSIERSAAGSPELLEAYYGLLTIEETMRPTPKTPEARMQVCLKALDAFPLDMQLLCAMGGYLQAAGRWDLALRSYETAYRYGQIHPEVWHMDQLRSVAAECYALSLQLQGNSVEARQVLEEALQAEPQAQRVRRQLLEMLVKHAERDAALELVDRNWAGPNREAMRSAVRGASLAAAQNWIAARAYLQVAYQAGCRETVCFRWFSMTLLASGAMDEARTLLNDWRQHEPTNLEPQRLLEAIGSGRAGQSTDKADKTDKAASPSRQLRIDQQGMIPDPIQTLPQVESANSSRTTMPQ